MIFAPKKLPSLDGWRAVSILMVLGRHSSEMKEFPGALGNPLFIPCFDGNLGVRFFFIISGFLITHLLLREQESTGGISLTAFYARRALRILPVYYAFLAAVGLMQCFTHFHQPLITWLGSLTFTVNYLPHGHITGHLWSLCVEEQFYLIWPPVLVWLLAHKRTRHFLSVLAVPVVVSLVCQVVAVTKSYPEILQPVFYNQSSLLNFDSLAVGCGAAFLLTWHGTALAGALAGGRKYGFSTLGLALILAPEYAPLLPWPALHFATAVFGNLLQALGFALLLLTSILFPGNFRPLNWRVVTQLGMLSYSIYIWQQFFWTDPSKLGFHHYWWLAFPGWLVPVLIAGTVSYYGLERPLLKLRSRFRKS